MQEIHKCISEREKPAVGQQCRAAQSLYVRAGVTAVADWMSTDVCQHLSACLLTTYFYTAMCYWTCVRMCLFVLWSTVYTCICTVLYNYSMCKSMCIHDCVHMKRTAYITVLSSIARVLNHFSCSVRCNADKIIALKKRFRDKWTFI